MKNFFSFYLRQFFILFIGLSFILSNFEITLAQLPSKKQSAKTKTENPNVVRWKILLDSLAQQAKTITPEERRPYAIADVAGAYWEIDRETSGALFVTALDAAWVLTEQNKKYRPMLNYVLSTATRLDSTLAKTLTKRLIAKEDSDKERDDISGEIALDILSLDAAKAAQLAEAFAPDGLRNGTASFFMYRLAQEDVQLSNRVYGVYLNKVGANENIPLEWILPLGGYAFGYAEFYTVDKSGQLRGGTFPSVKGLSQNPAFTNAFLNLAYRALVKTIERRNNAAGGDVAGYNYVILFAFEYLMPEIAKFSPNLLPAWQQLQQQGIVGTIPQQSQQIANVINTINQSRAKTRSYEESPQTAEQEAEASLENVEKLPGTCQRDVIYSKAALTFSSRKNFKRAISLVEEIEDFKQSESVQEVVFYDMTTAAIENEDWDEAQEKLKKISSLELSAMTHAQLAEALLKKNKKAEGAKSIDDAARVTAKLSEAETRTGFLFALSSMLLKVEPLEAQMLIRDAVKDLNRQEANDQMEFSIPIKVELACQGEDKTWYGEFLSLSNSNVFDALTLFAKQNPDEAELIAGSIDDKIIKLRSLAMITKVALAKEKAKAAK
jgi:tetratricopeptide (TPR) repeat protein